MAQEERLNTQENAALPTHKSTGRIQTGQHADDDVEILSDDLPTSDVHTAAMHET